ncbi:MAG: hypothetical protein M0R40_10165 [Firmicutes bacterium]|nr:hypothetical protein [Bacillota bacterium]
MTLENFRNSYRKTIPPKKTVMPELNSGNVMLPPMQSKPLLPGLPENFMLRQQAEPTDIRNLPNLPSKDGAAFAYPPDEPKLISRKSLDISKPQPFKDLKKGVPIVNKVLFAETYKKKFQTEDHPSLYAFYSQLDPDAKKEYYNILQKQGQESADKFLEAATQELFAKRGDKTAKLANRFSVPGRIALAGAAGLQSGVEGGRSAIKAVRGEKEQSLISAEQIGYQKARGEMGGVEGLASDVTYSIGRMAPSIAANALFPGAGTAVTFLTSGGSAYENALREGKGVNEARVYATMIGTSEAALQKIMGGVAARSGQTVIGKMAGEKITAVIEQLAKTPFMRMALHRLSDMAGEFTEEYLQDILEPVFRNIAFKENNEFKLFTKEALHSGLVGALTSGVMGFASGEDINVYRDAKAINAEYQKAGGDDVWGNISEWAGNKQFGQQAKEVNLPPKRDGAILPTKETVEALGIAQKLGVKAVVKDLPEGISGQYVNGEVIISSKTENPAMQVLFHELTHHIETAGEYGKFKAHVLNHIKSLGANIDVVRDGIISDYKDSGVTLTPSEAENELVAKFVESKMFTDEQSIKRLTQENRGLAQTIYNWISDVITKLAGTKEQKFMLEAQKMYEKALRSAEVANKEAMSKGRSYEELTKQAGIYDYSKSFTEQIKDYKQGLIPQYDTLLVGGTPNILQDIGFNALPVTINQSHVDFALNGTKDIDHFLGETILRQLPEKLEKPIAIMKSDSKSSNRVVALLEFEHNGKSVIAPVEIDGYGRQNDIRIDSNAITTVFAKDNAITKLLNNAVSKEAEGNISLFYWDKNRALSLLQRAGLQLPGGLPQDGSIHSIRESGANINTKFENVTETQQFKRWFGKSVTVDQYGKPFEVYHGTPDRGKDNFFVFKEGQGGFHFGTEEQALDVIRERKKFDGAKDGRLISAYIKLENPLVINYDIGNWSGHSLADFILNFERYNYNPEKYGVIDFTHERQKIGKEKLRAIADIFYNSRTEKGAELSTLEMQKLLKEHGYDGIKYLNDSEGKNPDFSYIVFDSNQIKSATDNIGTFDPNNPDIRYSQGDTFDEIIRKYSINSKQKKPPTTNNAFESPAHNARNESGTVSNTNIPQPEVEVNPQATSETAKAQQYRTRQEAGFANKIAQLLSVPGRASKESLRPIANELAQEFMRTGDISKESADALFEKAYSEGIVINEDFYNQYKGLKEELKTRRIAISDTDKASIPDYNKFRQSNFGTLKIVNDGTPVDTVYQELSGVYPELFPGEIMHPAEQLQHISEVAKSIAKTESDLDSFLGDDSEFFKKSARHEFNNELAGFKAEMSKVKRYNESRANKGQTIRSIEEISKDLAGLGKLKRQAEKVVAKHLLTDRDNAQVDRLLKGEIDFDDIPKNKGYNFEGIKAVYEAKKPAFDIENEFKRYNNQRLEEIHKGVAEDIETLHDWKKKKGEWRYIWRTMRRVVRNVVSDRGAAENIIEKYFDPIDDTEWGKIEFLTEKFNTVHDLELYPEESAAVQLLGEVDSEIDYLTSKKNLSKAETEKLGEIQQQKKVFLENSKDLDMAKVENAIKTFRGLYDDLFSKINEVRVKNGYMPIEYRKNYFPHFTKKQADSALGQALSGIFGNIEVKELPTEIAGKTKDFKPGTVWLPFGQRRKGNMTDYDAVKGFEMYAHLAADAIYHTDNIQRLRALAKGIRYFSSDENLKARIDKINNDADLSFEEKAERVNAIYENEDKSSGSAFVRVLEEYTNLLANKKSKRDRGAEDFFGRTNLYEMARRAESQAAANMVGFNIASAMTNFFPISQTMAATEKQAWLRAAAEAMMNNLENDGFEQQSGFLTRRKGLDPLIKTGLQKATEKAGAVFETVDMTTANFVVRAKYYEQLSKGKTHAEAMKIADTFAAEIMAERSKGAQPTLFGARNPFVKAFTMFQLEPANLLGNLFEDIPYQADGDKKEIAKRLFAYMVASYLFNNLYKKMFGRRMALDPIGLLADNLPDFLDEEISTSRVVMNIGKELAQEIPFLGGVLFDGGRLPITGALPSPKTVYKGIIGLSTGEMNKKKALSSLGKEFSKPGYLLLPPLGGMQAKKTVEGAMALQKGGSYGIDSQGRDVLQFPVDRTAGSVAKTLIGGKSSSKGSQDWVSSGFKSLSAKDTERYKEMIAGGAKPTEAYNIIKDEKSAAARETKEKKAFKERMAKEVPAFRYSDEVEGLIEQYKAKNEGASAPPIRPAERDRTFKTPANKIFSLTDDLLIERQRIYQEIVENAYQKIIGANMSMDKKIALLKAAHTKAKELADLKFFKKHEREVKKHKVILPMP